MTATLSYDHALHNAGHACLPRRKRTRYVVIQIGKSLAMAHIRCFCLAPTEMTGKLSQGLYLPELILSGQ